MKKFLLAAVSLFAMLSASAGIEGTYTVKSYTCYDLADDYTFANGTKSTHEDEDAEPWSITISKTDEGYTIENLLGWEEAIAAYIDKDGLISIIGGTELMDGYAICGSLSKEPMTAAQIMETCDQYWSYVPAWTLGAVTLKLEGDELVCQTPILIYAATDQYAGYVGYAYEVMDNLSYANDAEDAPAFAGEYIVKTYACYDLADDYSFANGEKTTQDDEDAEKWTVEVKKTDDSYVVENLLGWDESVAAAYDAETGVLSIAGGTEISDGYAICGSLGHNVTAEQIMSVCDQYWSYVPAWTLGAVTLKIEGDALVCQTPVLIYAASDQYDGYVGYAYEVVDGLAYEKMSGIQGNVNDMISNDTPIEYYNLQGVRLANPANGQIVIKRQGNNVSKVIIR